ncbi:MAG TPA: IS1 family transposase [Chthoniobacterales bacterium]|jgi:IS1 family transposase|nr:IS1 family transposase [Chthoniobacterales bacterium]
MNKLSTEERTQIVAALVEGNSMRSISRMTGASRNTIDKLLCDLGRACSDYQDKAFVNLKSKRIQCDEIWSFIYAKEKNCHVEHKAKGAGDVWTWVALDPDTKLVPCWFIGQRDAGCAYHFVHDLAERLAHRVQPTTDGHRAYLSAVEDAFGAGIDYAMLQKIYGNSEQGPETRYSPAICMGARKAVISGNPDHNHVSTSCVERQNLTMRMSMRRFTRLTNGHSKKLENHEHAVAIHYMYYNFGRIHQSLRVTPAMEAGISDHVWSIDEIISLLDSN